jgi:hypothetical protein
MRRLQRLLYSISAIAALVAVTACGGNDSLAGGSAAPGNALNATSLRPHGFRYVLVLTERNQTDKTACVTVYKEASGSILWSNIDVYCVHPQDHHDVYVGFDSDYGSVKVHAEVKDSNDCGGTTLAAWAKGICTLNLSKYSYRELHGDYDITKVGNDYRFDGLNKTSGDCVRYNPNSLQRSGIYPPRA